MGLKQNKILVDYEGSGGVIRIKRVLVADSRG